MRQRIQRTLADGIVAHARIPRVRAHARHVDHGRRPPVLVRRALQKREERVQEKIRALYINGDAIPVLRGVTFCDGNPGAAGAGVVDQGVQPAFFGGNF